MDKYHLISVVAYKGGELSTSFNLTRERMVENLAGYFEYLDYTGKNKHEIHNMISEDYRKRASSYAWDNGITVEIMHTLETGSVYEVSFQSFFLEIAEYIEKYWTKD